MRKKAVHAVKLELLAIREKYWEQAIHESLARQFAFIPDEGALGYRLCSKSRALLCREYQLLLLVHVACTYYTATYTHGYKHELRIKVKNKSFLKTATSKLSSARL
jgi:hypothetical protein